MNTEFVAVELSAELAETFRLLCQVAGDESRDVVIAVAIDRYYQSVARDKRTYGGEVVPLRLVDDESR